MQFDFFLNPVFVTDLTGDSYGNNTDILIFGKANLLHYCDFKFWGLYLWDYSTRSTFCFVLDKSVLLNSTPPPKTEATNKQHNLLEF